MNENEDSSKKLLIWIVVIGVLISGIGIIYVNMGGNNIEDKTKRNSDSLSALRNEKMIRDSITNLKEKKEEQIRIENKREEEERLERVAKRKELDFKYNKDFAEQLVNEGGYFVLAKGLVPDKRIDLEKLKENYDGFSKIKNNISKSNNLAVEQDEDLVILKKELLVYFDRLMKLYNFINLHVDQLGWYDSPENEQIGQQEEKYLNQVVSKLFVNITNVMKKYELGSFDNK